MPPRGRKETGELGVKFVMLLYDGASYRDILLGLKRASRDDQPGLLQAWLW